MSIVCATDLTIRSNPAVDAIAGLTERLGEREVWLVHVLNPDTRQMDANAYAQLRGSAERLLEAQAGLLRREGQAQVHTLVLEGPVPGALRAFAEAKRARLLVLGAPTPAALPVYQFAGTAERVIQASTVPVLVVRSAQPFLAWGRHERALSVVVGIDDTYSAQAVIVGAKDLARAGEVALTAVEVYYASDAGRRYGIPVRSWIQRDPEVEALVARDLARRVGEVPGATLKVRPQLGLGRLGDHLLDAAREEKADLVIVGTHDHHGLGRLGSTSAVVLAFGDVSTLVVPTQAVAPQVGGAEIRSVLVATDLSDFAGQGVAYAYEVLRGRGGEVHILHVDTTPALPLPTGPAGHAADVHNLPMDIAATPTGEESAFHAHVRALVPSPSPAGIVTHVHLVARRDVAAAISETAERLGADVVCIASHGRSGVLRMVLGSVAEKVARESRHPVLIVRPRQA
jgi:nucleotide-binding universal stress UspA family protein